MAFLTETAKITTPGDLNQWGSCFAENGLFVLLEVAGSEVAPAAQTGREILDLLLTKYTNYQERNLTTVKALLDETKEKDNVKTVIIGLLSGKVFYLGSYGEAKVVLKRNEVAGQILGSNETVSGHLQIGDRLLFYTGKLSGVITPEVKEKILSITDPEEALGAFTSSFLEDQQGRGSAILLLSVKEKKPEQLSDLVSKLRENGKHKLGRIFRKGRNLILNGEAGTAENPKELKAKKTLLTISVVLVGLLILSVFFNLNHERSSKNQKKLGEVIPSVSQQYEEAVNLVDLNPVRSRTLLAEAKLSLSALLKEFPKGSAEFKQVNEWLDKVSQEEVVAYKIYKLTAVPLFFDLNLVKQGGVGIKISGWKTDKAILDAVNKTVYSLSTETKQAGIVAGSEAVKDAKLITNHGKMIYLLNSDGIIGIDVEGKTAKVLIKPDEKWGEIASLCSFGGNLYLLDKKNNAIWKYIATDFGFSGRSNYLNPDVRANFGEAGSLVIDGSVWVAGVNEILKFTRGLGEQFAMKSFADTIQNMSVMTTGDMDKNIYILDKALSRIVVFNKEGEYQSQYQWDDLKKADDIISSEEEKKIFVLIGSKIYGIDLK